MEAKNTARALVRIGYDGSVHKFFRAQNASERFENELRVLQYLERRGCDFVPRVLGFDREKLELITSNCGQRVQQMSDEKLQSLFDELITYGVRHDDPFLRNITYRATDGRFCVIDFEFATILDEVNEGQVADDPQRAVGARPAALPSHKVRWSGRTDRGRFRPNNEDAFLAIAFSTRDFYYLAASGEVAADDNDFVFAVSDGMGGERSGEFASKFALDNITRLMPRRFQISPRHRNLGIGECLTDLFMGTHRQISTLGQSYAQGRNMGATLSMLWYIGGTVHFGHVGDSRIYHLPRQGGISQLTEDHTHVGWLRRSGKLNEREARQHPRKNVLSQSLGASNQFVKPQVGSVPAEPGDRFLLCTDGVIEGLWDRGLEELLRSPSTGDRGQSPASRIVEAAVAESGRDNATAVVFEVVSPQENATEAP
ncbi:MAG: Serine/threonine phosphatase stp [Planctomycetota bacterium]